MHCIFFWLVRPLSAAKEPGHLSVFTLSYQGVPTLVTVFKLDSDTRGQPLDIEFCRPVEPGGIARLAISFNDPSNPAADGTVRIYRALSPVSPTLEIIQTLTGKTSGTIHPSLLSSLLQIVLCGHLFSEEYC